MSSKDLSRLAAAIGEASGKHLQSQPTARVHGGSINVCYRWDGATGPIFVKQAGFDQCAAFAAEAAGLEELRRAAALRVPKVLSVGSAGDDSWLALEWIPFGRRSRAVDVLLGEGLAHLHRVTANSFGWIRDNTIGSTPQPNGQSRDWVEFFRDRRLRYQLDLAAVRGHRGRLQQRGAALLDRLGEMFATYQPPASLLHGDLWGGNWAADDEGQPVLFDPAVYYGDREADLAMTRLFGGFGAEFYSAYQATWPLDAGSSTRIELYNLYHVLNHLNLFGDAYLGRAVATIDGLMADLGH